jgi:hypothetical protein
MDGLPPDLQRLGDELTEAAARTTAAGRLRRETRRRLALTIAVGALVFAALTPAALGPAYHDLDSATFASLRVATYAPQGCDQARGARFTLVTCPDLTQIHRPYDWR